METNSKKILEALPDFNDALDLIEKIKELTIRKLTLESAIRAGEASNFVTVMTNEKYFVGGKPVAVSYYENAYKHMGLDCNLVAYRAELANIIAELDSYKSKSDLYRQMQDLYKSMVFSERA